MPTKCHVINCTEPSVGNDLCRKHYMRMARTGALDDSRSSDWGKREKHPAYRAWCNLRRHHLQDTQSSWLADFWAFVSEIPAKPERATAFRKDKLLPWSKDNFYWREIKSCSEDAKAYAREWQKKSRLIDPEYHRNKELLKAYGVTLEWYRETLASQNDACAICKQPETTLIRGKVINMSVDHNHITGAARGLLCTQCNRALGLFKDNEYTLQSAISYLRMQNDE